MTELTDLSETDASNTTITAINIDEGCAPSGINNAIRNTLGLIRRAFKASIFRLRDSTDQTKLLAFDLSGLTTATTRTVTIPDRSGILATGVASSTDNAILRFNGGAGEFQNSLVTIDDSGSLALPAGQTVSTSNVLSNGVLIMAATTNNIALRPNGAASAAGQILLSTSGAVTISGSSATLNGGFSTAGTAGMTFSAGTISTSAQDALGRNHVNFYNTNGAVGSITTSGSATSYNTSSDENLKNFIGEYDPVKAIQIIRSDPVREFTWKVDGASAVGWGAQSSYAVSPDLATPGRGEPGDEDFVSWGVDQSKRTPYLWAAVTHLLDKIDNLEARLEALEGPK